MKTRSEHKEWHAFSAVPPAGAMQVWATTGTEPVKRKTHAASMRRRLVMVADLGILSPSKNTGRWAPPTLQIAQHRQPALRALTIAHRPRSGATRIRRPHLRTIARPLSITATPSTQAGGTPPPRRCIASVISRRTGRETYGNESRMVSTVNYRDIMRPIGNGLPERAEMIGWCGCRAGFAPSYCQLGEQLSARSRRFFGVTRITVAIEWGR